MYVLCLNCSRFLQIGVVEDMETFDSLLLHRSSSSSSLEVVEGVDLIYGGTHRMTSDEYFTMTTSTSSTTTTKGENQQRGRGEGDSDDHGGGQTVRRREGGKRMGEEGCRGTNDYGG